MKESIYSIPLTESFSEKCECSFCLLEKNYETKMIDYCLGAAMMEPDFREITNKKGFCKKHFHMLYENGNRLSFSLICSTHIDEIIESINNISMPKPKKMFQKAPQNDTLSEIISIHNTCTICDQIESVMNKYIDVFFYLYKSEKDFKDKYEQTDGFCLNHFLTIYQSASKFLSSDELSSFLLSLTEKQKKYLSLIREDILYFCKKHDYRFKDMDWKNSKDAPVRILKILSGDQ